MKINNKVMKISMALLLVLAVYLAFLRFDMLHNNKLVDELGLYTDKGAGNLFGALVLVLIVVTAGYAFLARTSSFEQSPNGVIHRASSALCMLFVLTSGISAVYELIGFANRVAEQKAASLYVTEKLDILLVIEMLLAFASVAYFLYVTIKGSCGSMAEASLALIPVIWLAVRAIRLFMNIETQINASSRSLTLLMLVVTMMFFLAEAERSVPKGKQEETDEAISVRTAKYIGFGLICVELALISAVAPIFAGGLQTDELVCSLTDVSLALFAAVRLFTLKVKE